MAFREKLIRDYFYDGHSYRVILVLLGLQGFSLSLRELQRILQKMGLRRRVRILERLLRRLICLSSRPFAKVCR